MKRTIAVLALLAATICGCSSISVNESGSQEADEQVKKIVGAHTFVLWYLDQSRFNYQKAVLNQSVYSPATGEKGVNKLESWPWEENRYFLLELRHIIPYDIKKGDFSFSMTDAKGTNLIEDMMAASGAFSDTVQLKSWYIKTGKAITAANFTAEAQPVTLTVNFFKGQKKTYTLTPNK